MKFGARMPWRLAPAIATAVMVMGLALVSGMSHAASQMPPCRERVEALAKAMSDRPGLQELKHKLAQAALLCRDGEMTEANKLLAQVEEALKQLPRDGGAPG